MQKQYSDRPRVCPSFVGANVSPEIGPFNFAAYNKKKSRCCAAVDGRPNRALRGSSVLATLCHMTRCRCKYAFSRVLLDLSCSLQQESVCCEEILPRNTKKIGTATTYSSPVVPAACYCCCCCCKLCVHHCTQQLQLYLFTTSAVLAVQREQGGWSSLKFDFRMRNHQRPDPTARPLGVEETRHTPSASVHLHGVRVQQVSRGLLSSGFSRRFRHLDTITDENPRATRKHTDILKWALLKATPLSNRLFTPTCDGVSLTFVSPNMNQRATALS